MGKLFIDGKEITPPDGIEFNFDSSETERVREGILFWKCPTCGEVINSEELLKIADKVYTGNCGMRFAHMHCPGCGEGFIQPLGEEILEDYADAVAKAVKNNPNSPLLDMCFGRLTPIISDSE